MRSTARALMAAAMQSGNSLKPTPMALLPPIYLYRRLLRAHRKHLPAEMRLLGDEYVKAEFRAHRSVENPVHLIGFLTEWQLYAQKIEGDAWRGEKLDEGKIQKMSDEQIGQLYELMQAIQKRGTEGDES
ncbi:Bifunctional NAD(P)H-hydrate repair enzyme [Podospora bellae-mahoneyi]|uniref:Succinate dehydrogenase assembly factor 3 n=3 Tax=Podospora TaxID=5144 RepID=A0ABY6RWB8_PODCO|nr:Bifunctional NAD(P)H-hydrate repair enzyme [Podospora bellae-mahoneyi]KAK4681876.1 Bifunctional NAD(P)H-hydrate repair enzyme [Podospora pseudoanserina]VBB72606.1 Putative mitochondrial acetate non-utilizing protein 9 precursor [Podospora comata]